MTDSIDYVDIAVIGTGSGNSLLDDSFADKKAAIFEKGRFGGTCLNVGCIPTKMFVYAADRAEEIAKADQLNLNATLNSVHWSDLVERVFDNRIDPIADGGEQYRRQKCDNITVYDGAAKFVGPRTIESGDGRTVRAETVVIAAGARPSIPQIVADSQVKYYTNNDIMRVSEPPKHLVILGSGYIGTEFAHVFSALGSEVTIIGRSQVLLKELDHEIASRFTMQARERWNVHLGASMKNIGPTEADGSGVRIEFHDGSIVSGDALLVATGRTPNGDQLNLDAAGIQMNGESIAVDQFGRTSAEGVWALGDVSSPFQLKHVANHELRTVHHNILYPDDMRAFDRKAVPFAVFSEPQVASVGMTELQARGAGHDVTVKTQEYGDVAYGWAMADSGGCCKLVADRSTDRLLGAHILGRQASTLIQPLIQAITFDTPVSALARGQYWIHPALTEVLENALLGLDITPDRP